MSKILVTYASKRGATEEIADAIVEVLKNDGLDVILLPVSSVTSIEGYDAIILGSAVYIGQWMRDANKFVKEYLDDLSHIPTWIFSSGPTGEGNPSDLMNGFQYPEKLEPYISRINLQEAILFHGALDMTELNWLERRMIKTVEAPLGDFRNWHSIKLWAQHIADSLHLVAAE